MFNCIGSGGHMASEGAASPFPEVGSQAVGVAN